jgi:thioesterase domain-containing protein
VRLDALPLTPNGKLDRGALPAPGGDAYATHGYEAPVGEVETALAQIWSELLNVERVGRRDNFFALGGHSLQAVQVASRAEQVLGAKAEHGDLFVRPVLADFARGLREDLSGSAGAASTGAELPVAVRATGSERPLFLFHEGTGSVKYAQVLAWQVSAEIPVYALPPLLDPGCSLRTVPDMGARFVRMIRSVQRAGPYRLAGHSLGGNFAYEAAAQLVAQDQEIEFLGMIDSEYLNASERNYPRPRLAGAFRRLCTREGVEGWSESTLQELLSRPELSDLGALIRAGDEAGLFAQRHSAERISQLEQQMWYYPLAFGAYTPLRISVQVSFFEAAEQGSDTPLSQAWRTFLTEGSVRVVPVPGNHMSVMAPEHVSVLGQAMSREIARAARDHASGLVEFVL